MSATEVEIRSKLNDLFEKKNSEEVLVEKTKCFNEYTETFKRLVSPSDEDKRQLALFCASLVSANRENWPKISERFVAPIITYPFFPQPLLFPRDSYGIDSNSLENWAKAAECYNTAIDILKPIINLADDDKWKLVFCYNGLGSVYFGQRNWLKAAECYSAAINIFKSYTILTDEDKRKFVISYSNLGFAYSEQGNWLKAAECYSAAIEILGCIRNFTDEDKWEYVQYCLSLGNRYWALGQLDDARTWFKIALRKILTLTRCDALSMKALIFCYATINNDLANSDIEKNFYHALCIGFRNYSGSSCPLSFSLTSAKNYLLIDSHYCFDLLEELQLYVKFLLRNNESLRDEFKEDLRNPAVSTFLENISQEIERMKNAFSSTVGERFTEKFVYLISSHSQAIAKLQVRVSELTSNVASASNEEGRLLPPNNNNKIDHYFKSSKVGKKRPNEEETETFGVRISGSDLTSDKIPKRGI